MFRLNNVFTFHAKIGIEIILHKNIVVDLVSVQINPCAVHNLNNTADDPKLNDPRHTNNRYVKLYPAPHSHDYPRSSTDELPMQVLIALLSSSPDCGENTDNRTRGVVHISRCVGVYDGESTEKG